MDSPDRPLICHVLDTLAGGGTERYLLGLLHRFDRARFRHAVVTLRTAGPLAAQLPDDVACHPLETRPRSRFAFLPLRQALRRLNATAVHARNIGCWVDATLAVRTVPRCHLILGFHGCDHGPNLTSLQCRKAKWTAWAGARFTSVSQEGIDLLHRQAGIPLDRCTLLSNGVDTQRFQPAGDHRRAEARRRADLPERAFVIGMVAGLVPVKRHDLLLEALHRLGSDQGEPVAAIAGDGPCRGMLSRRAAALGLSHRWQLLGTRPAGDILPALDTLVSCSDSEGLSNALLEAMAAGLPVIATSVGDHPRRITDGVNGLLIPPGDAAALASAVRRLRLDNELRQRLGQAARNTAVEHDLQGSVVAYERYYSKVLARSVPPVAAVRPEFLPVR